MLCCRFIIEVNDKYVKKRAEIFVLQHKPKRTSCITYFYHISEHNSYLLDCIQSTLQYLEGRLPGNANDRRLSPYQVLSLGRSKEGGVPISYRVWWHNHECFISFQLFIRSKRKSSSLTDCICIDKEQMNRNNTKTPLPRAAQSRPLRIACYSLTSASKSVAYIL